MKTYSFSKEEMEVLTFHLRVNAYHEMVLKQYIGNIATGRLKLPAEAKMSYDLNKGELYVEEDAKQPKSKDKRGKDGAGAKPKAK